MKKIVILAAMIVLVICLVGFASARIYEQRGHIIISFFDSHSKKTVGQGYGYSSGGNYGRNSNSFVTLRNAPMDSLALISHNSIVRAESMRPVRSTRFR